MANIKGTEGLTGDQLYMELQTGGQFVIFQYCISIIVITFRRNSDVYFVRANESAGAKGFKYSLLTLLLGWWGIPWGPIYSIGSLLINFKGGKDVTQEVLASLNRAAGSAGTP